MNPNDPRLAGVSRLYSLFTVLIPVAPVWPFYTLHGEPGPPGWEAPGSEGVLLAALILTLTGALILGTCSPHRIRGPIVILPSAFSLLILVGVGWPIPAGSTLTTVGSAFIVILWLTVVVSIVHFAVIGTAWRARAEAAGALDVVREQRRRDREQRDDR